MLSLPAIFAALFGAAVLSYFYVSVQRKKDRSSTPTLLACNKNIENTGEKASAYTKFHEMGGGTKEDRVNNAQEMVNHYYDLSSDFYLFGWGESFHFAPRMKRESFMESLYHHEYYLASRLQVDPGANVLDLGCGVGGPMRNIARFSGVNVTGVNNNDYQLTRVAAFNAAAGLSDQCKGIKGDFMALTDTIERESYDGAYAIEATCHAPDRTACFRQIYDTLKPGARFVCYEWVMTDKYDPKNPVHKQLKDGIELGNSLPDINTAGDVEKSLAAAGFNVIEVTDLADPKGSPVPWYEPFEPKWTLSGFKTTPLGIKLTNVAVSIMEKVKLAPKGSAEMHDNLSVAAITLYEAGKLGIFTPMLLCVAQKPL